MALGWLPASTAAEQLGISDEELKVLTSTGKIRFRWTPDGQQMLKEGDVLRLAPKPRPVEVETADELVEAEA